MSKSPKDLLGNSLHEGNLVTFLAGQPLVFKIVALSEGGLHTNSGQTPAQIRIICDMSIGCPPGGRIPTLLRIINPESEAVISAILKDVKGVSEPPVAQ